MCCSSVPPSARVIISGVLTSVDPDIRVLCMVHTIELVDSIRRDSVDMKYNANTNKFLKISKTANL